MNSATTGVYNSNKWLCCGEAIKSTTGCQPISWVPRPSKSEPAPPVPVPPTVPGGGAVEAPPPPERQIVVAVYPFTVSR